MPKSDSTMLPKDWVAGHFSILVVHVLGMLLQEHPETNTGREKISSTV
jgi:hypothetical protein